MSKKETENVVTLGCRLNTFESEAIKQNLKKANISDDVIVINTCTVTANAHRQSKQEIRRAKKNNPNKKIIVTGCAVENNFDDFVKMEEVFKVVKNSDKLKQEPYNLNNSSYESTNLNSEITTLEIPKLENFGNKTRAFVQIQQGCDHKCSFCIIPQTRGKSISLDKKEVISHIENLVSKNYQEIVLTGVDISSWQREEKFEQKSKLGSLCKEILHNVPNLKRLRLSSLDPAARDDDILDLLKNDERLMPHFHFSLQSLSNPVLKNMGRRHSKEQASDWLKSIKKANNDVVFGADFITGFPRESDENFKETMQTTEDLFIPFLHVFPYSERQGTVAYNFKQKVEVNTRRQRAKELIKKGNELKETYFQSRLGKVEDVLFEGSNKGYSKYFAPVMVEDNFKKGTFCKVKITGYNNDSLIGKVV